MSPARTTGDDIDLDKLLHRIVLDLHLFRFFAVNGRGLAALSAIDAARRIVTGDAPILNWIESWIGDAIAGPTPPNGPPPAAA